MRFAFRVRFAGGISAVNIRSMKSNRPVRPNDRKSSRAVVGPFCRRCPNETSLRLTFFSDASVIASRPPGRMEEKVPSRGYSGSVRPVRTGFMKRSLRFTFSE